MTATLIPIGPLKSYVGDRADVRFEAGLSVRETLQALSIPPELVALVTVNGEQQMKDYIVRPGDVVKVIAVLGGG